MPSKFVSDGRAVKCCELSSLTGHFKLPLRCALQARILFIERREAGRLLQGRNQKEIGRRILWPGAPRSPVPAGSLLLSCPRLRLEGRAQVHERGSGHQGGSACVHWRNQEVSSFCRCNDAKLKRLLRPEGSSLEGDWVSRTPPLRFTEQLVKGH